MNSNTAETRWPRYYADSVLKSTIMGGEFVEHNTEITPAAACLRAYEELFGDETVFDVYEMKRVGRYRIDTDGKTYKIEEGEES